MSRQIELRASESNELDWRLMCCPFDQAAYDLSFSSRNDDPHDVPLAAAPEPFASITLTTNRLPPPLIVEIPLHSALQAGLERFRGVHPSSRSILEASMA